MCCCVDMNAEAGRSSVCGEVSGVHNFKKKKVDFTKTNKKTNKKNPSGIVMLIEIDMHHMQIYILNGHSYRRVYI